jgi:hypothetical protein
MKRRRGAIKTDIGNKFAALGFLIETGKIGALMQKATLDQYGEQAGLGTKIAGHGKPSRKRSRAAHQSCAILLKTRGAEI